MHETVQNSMTDVYGNNMYLMFLDKVIDGINISMNHLVFPKSWFHLGQPV